MHAHVRPLAGMQHALGLMIIHTPLWDLPHQHRLKGINATTKAMLKGEPSSMVINENAKLQSARKITLLANTRLSLQLMYTRPYNKLWDH